MSEVFFSEAGRGLLVEQIIHHGSFTQDAIILTGVLGVGKSACALALCDELANDAALLIDLKTPADKDAIDQYIAQSPNASAFQQALSGDTTYDHAGVWLVIDNAQLLAPDALAHLAQQFSLLEQGALVLCVEDSAVSGVAAALADIESQVFELAPFSTSQMQQYIDFWFAAAGSEQELNPQDIQAIVTRAQGLPGLAIEPLTQLLLKQASAKIGVHPSSSSDASELEDHRSDADSPSPFEALDKPQQEERTMSFQAVQQLVEKQAQSFEQSNKQSSKQPTKQSSERSAKQFVGTQAESLEISLLEAEFLDDEDVDAELKDDQVILSGQPEAAKVSELKEAVEASEEQEQLQRKDVNQSKPQGKSARNAKRKQSRRDKNRKKRAAKQSKPAAEDQSQVAPPKQSVPAANAKANTKLKSKPEQSEPGTQSAKASEPLKSKPPSLYPYLLMFLITCVLGWFMLALFYPDAN